MLKTRSLTQRLTWLYIAVSSLVLLGFGSLVALAISQHFAELDQQYLADKLHVIQNIHAHDPHHTANALHPIVDGHHGLSVQLYQQGKLIYQSAPQPAAIGLHPLPLDTLFSLSEQGENYHGLCVANTQNAQSETLPSSVRCALLNTRHHQHFMDWLLMVLGLFIVAAAAVAGVLGWWATRRGLAPLHDIKQQLQHITAQRLDVTLTVDSVPAEMTDLVNSLNGLLWRLQHDFQRLSEFSSDLAHELRTPLSNLLTETQVAISQARSADSYRQTLASNAEEFERLARMVSDMLFLAKTEHGLSLPSCVPLPLETEVHALFEFYEALAEEKNVLLQCDGQLTIEGDKLMLRRALSNLLSNALRYAPAGGWIRVEMTSDAEGGSLQVSNNGPAIAVDDLPRLFDRFFRADKSRLHSEGSGLGLAITRSIVELHGGTISATSTPTHTSFRLFFPRKTPSKPHASK